MNIQTVRRTAHDLRIALNADAWRNRLDSLGIQITVTNGPEVHGYDYGIQIVYRAANLQVSMHVIPLHLNDDSRLYGILSGTLDDYCRSKDLEWIKCVHAMELSLRSEIEAAFGCKPEYAC